MSKIDVHGFGYGVIIDLPSTLPKNLQEELKNKLRVASKSWVNKEIKSQAQDLKEMLVRNTHKDTGLMANSWEISYPQSVADDGMQISFYNTAERKSYPYPYVEEFGVGYFEGQYVREGHHTTQKTIDNDFLPTVMIRMRKRFKQRFGWK